MAGVWVWLLWLLAVFQPLPFVFAQQQPVSGTITPKPFIFNRANEVRAVTKLEPEIIKEYLPGNCAPDAPDFADATAFAFRDAEGNVQLIASVDVNRRFVGPNLDSLTYSCDVIFKGDHNPDVQQNNDHGWLHGFNTQDGKTIHALVHNEYWGHSHHKECKDYKSCWWNSITWAVSTDGGKTYTSPPVEERLVATVAKPFKVNAGQPVGYANPSPVVESEGYLYSIIHAWKFEDIDGGNYLIRKKVEAPWGQWQVWNGERAGFIDIRRQLSRQKSGAIGKPLDIGTEAQPMLMYGLVKHEASGLFVALIPSGLRTKLQPENDGFFLSVSRDLIHWTEPEQVIQANYMSGFDCKAYPAVFFRYGNLIDPTSTDRNFSTIGDKPYIYTTRYSAPKCGQATTNGKLELVRIPLDIADYIARAGKLAR